MKLSNSYFFTIREDVKDEDSVSGNLLVRSGMAKKVGAGIYMYLPLGFKVLQKIESIVRTEMNKAGAIEVLMPALIPLDYYRQAGRDNAFGDDMFKLHDRFNKEYALGPTHEELFTIAASLGIKSYKDMPLNLYQIQNKYRDEMRPRFGLVRIREFKMKDAYSFDTDLAGLDVAYQKMDQAYRNIFNKIGIDYRVVKAPSGAMGGILSEEFQALSDKGEDTLVLCDTCDFARNIEVAETVAKMNVTDTSILDMEKVHTPDVRTVEEVANYLNVSLDKIVKTLLYQVDEEVIAFLLPGHLTFNEEKVREALGAKTFEMVDEDKAEAIAKARVGCIGPVNLGVKIIMDQNISFMRNFVVGANENDYHLVNVNIEDFNATEIMDLTLIEAGDKCPVCGGTIYFKKGIEIGNIFKLGTKYSEALNCMYTTKENKLEPYYMGCYGIGIGRILASYAEQNNDDKGLKLPASIAPYEVCIVVSNVKDEQQMEIANQMYDKLISQGVDVLIDDRDERLGVKFKDMELIGIPKRITVGKHVVNNQVEVYDRFDDSVLLVDIKDV